jgi:hypothetical protein
MIAHGLLEEVLVIPGFVESQSNTEIRKYDREHIENIDI